MNEFIEGLKSISAEVENEFGNLCKTINGECDRQEAEQRFYTIKRRYIVITIIVCVVCLILLFLKIWI